MRSQGFPTSASESATDSATDSLVWLAQEWVGLTHSESDWRFYRISKVPRLSSNDVYLVRTKRGRSEETLGEFKSLEDAQAAAQRYQDKRQS
jgi:hypothetical protein